GSAVSGRRQAPLRVLARSPAGADVLAKSPTVIDGIWPRKSGSHQTHRWSEVDSNCRSLSRNGSVSPAERELRKREKGSLEAANISGGTGGSNPVSSSGESSNHRFPARTDVRPARPAEPSRVPRPTQPQFRQ